VVGVSGLFLDFAVFALFADFILITAWISEAIAKAVAIGYNFTLNKYWSFQSDKKAHKQLVRFLIVAGFNYVFAVVSMYFFHEQIGFHKYLVKASTVAIMVSWNFLLYKYWVYKE
ncbi:MAG: GtrA family protein, partial [Candidatus Magasanikbacteria bacterium]